MEVEQLFSRDEKIQKIYANSNSDFFGFENDLDWSRISEEKVYKHAQTLANDGNLFRVDSESFFSQLGGFISKKLEKEKSGKPNDVFHMK